MRSTGSMYALLLSTYRLVSSNGHCYRYRPNLDGWTAFLHKTHDICVRNTIIQPGLSVIWKFPTPLNLPDCLEWLKVVSIWLHRHTRPKSVYGTRCGTTKLVDIRGCQMLTVEWLLTAKWDWFFQILHSSHLLCRRRSVIVDIGFCKHR